MAVTDVWTLAEAKEMLAAWKAAAKALASGTVKEYTIGTRKLTMLDMNTIHAQINYFSDTLDVLQGKANTRRVRTVVFRDT